MTAQGPTVLILCYTGWLSKGGKMQWHIDSGGGGVEGGGRRNEEMLLPIVRPVGSVTAVCALQFVMHNRGSSHTSYPPLPTYA